MSCCLLSRCIHGIHNVLKIKPMTSHQYTHEHPKVWIMQIPSVQFHLETECISGVDCSQAVCVAAMSSMTVDSVHKLLPKDLYPNWLVFPELEKVIDLVLPYIQRNNHFHLVLTTSCIVSNCPLPQLWDFSSGIRSLWKSIGCFAYNIINFFPLVMHAWTSAMLESESMNRENRATRVREITSSNSRLQGNHQSF